MSALVDGSSLGMIKGLDNVASETLPLILMVSTKQAEALQKSNMLERYRSQFFIDYGVHLPEITLKAADDMPESKVIFLINEIKATEFSINFSMLKVVNGKDELELLGFEIVKNNNEYWSNENDRESLSNLGVPIKNGC
ncbi:Invasion protein invA [Serratia fonticola]|uniref:Invasion protein invA n=1 Tax=Serratia fonticola TaxID=47917 RepID=A0A4U9US91_SERFO|nr:Invasion protein invA [Serratia fonticola]